MVEIRCIKTGRNYGLQGTENLSEVCHVCCKEYEPSSYFFPSHFYDSQRLYEAVGAGSNGDS
jgi:hypothetical protein